MKIRSAGVLVTALALSGSLAACGSGSTSSSNSAQGGGTVVVDTAFQLKTADPGRMFEPTGLLIAESMYDTLLTFKGSDVTKPVPALAESYTASPDGKTFTFKLRTDAKFSDGSPVTSADVVFSLNRVKNVKGNPSFLMDGLTVTAPDANSVVITSDKPNAAVPFILPNPALGILNSTVVKQNGGTDAVGADKTDTAESFLNSKSQGSGPYILNSYSTTTQVVLTPNDKYWGTKPKYSKVVVRNVQANVQRLNVVKGESQVAVDLSPEQAKGLNQLQVVNGASPNVFFLFSNNNAAISKTASNPKFQEAVRYGVDYKGLVDLAGQGAVQTPGIVPSMFLGALSSGDAVTRDVAKAKAALAASGLSNPTVALSYPSDVQVNGLNFGDLAARVQANLKEVGITVNLAPASVQTALETYRGGKEEMGLWQWGPDYPDPSDYLNFLPGQLVGLRAGWAKGADSALETLGTQAASTIDDSQRAGLYKQIQQSMNKSGPIMPLIQPAQILVGAKSVKNLQSNALWLVNVRELG
ncbi:MAG: transporter substrate-binding protein [Dactylosporangium sp.]|jgi:peptide/nickel transport system substrate-binding protein|nr:transporter substrate-binding protein [Dactylosporangium sp.]